MTQLTPKLKTFPHLKEFERRIEEAKVPSAKRTFLKRKLQMGTLQIAKKMGEEMVELVIAAGQQQDDAFLEEAADVLQYYLISLHDRGYSLRDVLLVLQTRDVS